MKYVFIVLAALTVASSANAVTFEIVPNNKSGINPAAPSLQRISISTSNGKSVVKMVSKDGTSQEYTIPYYTLSNADSALRNMIPNNVDGRKFTDMLVKQAQGSALTKEESALIAELAVDSKTYDDNMKLLQPVCSMPSPSGISVSSSLSTAVPSCTKLSAAEIAAAPHIEQDKTVRMAISVADASYRFKLPKEERQKLRRQNIDLAIKWSEM